MIGGDFEAFGLGEAIPGEVVPVQDMIPACYDIDHEDAPLIDDDTARAVGQYVTPLVDPDLEPQQCFGPHQEIVEERTVDAMAVVVETTIDSIRYDDDATVRDERLTEHDLLGRTSLTNCDLNSQTRDPSDTANSEATDISLAESSRGVTDHHEHTLETDAGGAGSGDGDYGVYIVSEEDPDEEDERRMAGFMESYPRFAATIDDLRNACARDDYTERSDFIAHEGAIGDEGQAKFLFSDPLTDTLCVVGIQPPTIGADGDEAQDDGYEVVEDRERSAALARGAQAPEWQRDRIEQLVAVDPVTYKPVRKYMSGVPAAELSTKEKTRIDKAAFTAAADTLRFMVEDCGVVPDAVYGEKTIIDVADGNAVRFTDYPRLRTTDRPPAVNEQLEAGALFGVVQALGVPSEKEKSSIQSWLEGARLFRIGLQVLAERYPSVQREKDAIVGADDMRVYQGDVSPSYLNRALLEHAPFFQAGHRMYALRNMSETEKALTSGTLQGFIFGLGRVYTSELTQISTGKFDVMIQARDERPIYIAFEEDEDGRIIDAAITIFDGQGQITDGYSLSYLDTNDPNFGIVTRTSIDRVSGAHFTQEIDMQELAGLLDYADMGPGSIPEQVPDVPMSGSARDDYFEYKPDGLHTSAEIARERWEVRHSTPRIGPPTPEWGSNICLRLPHGIKLQCTLPFLTESGRLAIDYVYAPPHLRGSDTPGGYSAAQRLYADLRERCIVAGISEITHMAMNASSLRGMLHIVAEGDTVEIRDSEDYVLTLEEAIQAVRTEPVNLRVQLGSNTEHPYRPELFIQDAAYYAPVSPHESSGDNPDQDLADVFDANPMPGLPDPGSISERALRLPHGCSIEFTGGTDEKGLQRMVIDAITVPPYLAPPDCSQNEALFHTGRRLVNALRQIAIAEGIDYISANVTDRRTLVSVLYGFGWDQAVILQNDEALQFYSDDEMWTWIQSQNATTLGLGVQVIHWPHRD